MSLTSRTHLLLQRIGWLQEIVGRRTVMQGQVGGELCRQSLDERVLVTTAYVSKRSLEASPVPLYPPRRIV